jgi:transcriptional regulator with XRE-family HTH domain
MKKLRVRRELADLSQVALARCAGVSRMRLQLAEAGEIELRPEEVETVNRVLHNRIKRRASTLMRALV